MNADAESAACARRSGEPCAIAAAAGEIRQALRKPLAPGRIAAALAATFDAWRDRGYAPRRETLGAIGAARGWSAALLEQSLDALLAPFTPAALREFARTANQAGALIGMIMPGNAPGAGMHELTAALLSGCGVMLKTATAEPLTCAAIARTLRATDAEVGARLATFNWSREAAAASAALAGACDWIAAFGADATIADLNRQAADAPGASRPPVGFGARYSGAVVAGLEQASEAATAALAAALARDVSLFEQLGCLSPHQVMVETATAEAARAFARRMAAALERAAASTPPSAEIPLEAAAAIRRMRESARWRALGGDREVELREGGGWGERPRWSVIYDDRADFTISPGYRTLTIARFAGDDDLRGRLAPFQGQFEAFALAAPDARADALRRILRGHGATFVCAPGAMQSPPLAWPHGGGAFLARLRGAR